MWGKSVWEVESALPRDEVVARIEAWRGANGLVDVSRVPGFATFRYGSRHLSNPIFIEIAIDETPIRVRGWVQTGIRFISWTLVEIERETLLSRIDYRRKGGLFVSRLRAVLG